MAADPEPPSGMLIGLAPELLELVLCFLPPRDLLSFGRSCRRASAFVKPSNQVLWRAIFLRLFDDPKAIWACLQPTARAENRRRESSWDWYVEIRRRCVAYKAICQAAEDASLERPEEIVQTLLDVLETASYSATEEPSARVSLNLDYLERLFAEAPDTDRLVHDWHRDLESPSLPFGFEFVADLGRPITRSMRGYRTPIPDWASRFHIAHGMTEREGDSIQSKASARALVYDWSMSGPATDYGPFNKDGSGTVNWQIVEATCSLMHRVFNNTRKVHHLRIPSGFRKSIPYLIPSNPSITDDWAGVTGTWIGTYAFLDYRALVHYNFANNLQYFSMDLGAYEEACGDLLPLRLEISDSEELRDDPKLKTNLPRCKDVPVLYFEGKTHGRPTGQLPISTRGCASLVPGGRHVRWRFIINYAEQDQWQLEGVQPGGIRSGGIYGLWSHVDHDDHGPIGPFSYFPFEACDLC